MHGGLSGLRYTFNTPAKLREAPLVAEVIVESHGTPHWNSVDRQGPTESNRRRILRNGYAIYRNGYAIYTPLNFTHFRTLFDRRSGPTDEFVMPRGQVDTDPYRMAGFPLLTPGGQYVVVFTPSVVANQRNPNPNILLAYQAFPVDDNGVVLLRRGGDPTEPGVGALTPELTMTLLQLQAHLASGS